MESRIKTTHEYEFRFTEYEKNQICAEISSVRSPPDLPMLILIREILTREDII